MAPFFRAALQGDFKEAVEATVFIPEDLPAVVQRFQLWAYTGSVLLVGEDIKKTGVELWLLQLYFFAERYDIPDLQNCVIDIFTASWATLVDAPVWWPQTVYDNTSSISPLRRLMVDMYAQVVDLEDAFAPASLAVDHDHDRYPKSFLFALAVELYKFKEGDGQDVDFSKCGCTYHVHPSATTGSKQQTGSEG